MAFAQSGIMMDFLKEQGIRETLLNRVAQFRKAYALSEDDASRLVQPRYFYYGKEVWEEALTALLCGENLLLVGSKATGKNVLAENLAAVFGRPDYNVSFHINMDASFMIGTDTFQNGAVCFRPGPVYLSAVHGGFCILDEINMARNEALAVLHSVLDYRRMIDVPGYSRIMVHDAARFIGTMNHGYAGTRELNEALASRFVIINTPELSGENLQRLLKRAFPSLKSTWLTQFSDLFLDIEKKFQNGEISAKPLDLRGMMDALRLMQAGLNPVQALDMGMTNKTFDAYEQKLVKDLIASRISSRTEASDLFDK